MGSYVKIWKKLGWVDWGVGKTMYSTYYILKIFLFIYQIEPPILNYGVIGLFHIHVGKYESNTLWVKF